MIGLIVISFTYFFFELNAINIVHDYYMFPFLPWLYVVVGLGIELIKRFHKYLIFLLFGLCIISALYTPPRTEKMWSLEKTYFNNDVNTYANELKRVVPKNATCIILNDPSTHMFSYQIDKIGYVFKDDYLPATWIEDMIRNKDVRYMYSDSEKINTNKYVQVYLDSLILEIGSVKVFRLGLPPSNPLYTLTE